MKTILFIASILLSNNTTPAVGSNLTNDSISATTATSKSETINQSLEKRYASMDLGNKGLSMELFKKGITGFLNLKSEGKVKKDVITLIDFEKPSSEKRMWIIDLAKNKVLKNTLVAHGRNSGQLQAETFSNKPNSFSSSLGCYVTSNTYTGKHGLSLKLQGLDEEFNTNAESRNIVMHGASYVSEDFVKCTGRLGRSHGCPAVPESENVQIIELIKDGSFLFINGKSDTYTSDFLNQESMVTNYELLPQTI